MNRLFDVSHEDIESLDAMQLTKLMQYLLYLEASSNNISKSCVSCPTCINTPDGGQDACVIWEGGVNKTNWFPSRNCIFQFKATDFGPSKCYKELFKDESKFELKTNLVPVAENNYHYIIINNKSLNSKQAENRTKIILNGFHKADCNNVSESNISIYSSDKITEWTNEHLAATVFVKDECKKSISPNFQTWERWSNYKDIRKLKYTADKKRTTIIEELQNELCKPKNILRLIGLSGLGKTRLVLEAFKPPEDGIEDKMQDSLSYSVVYCDCQDIDTKSLTSDVMSLINSKKKGIIVFDNCNRNLHCRLEQEISHNDSFLSMISIDNDPSEQDDQNIILDRMKDDVIRKIVLQEFPDLIYHEDYTDKIVKLSDGFPKIADLLAHAVLNKKENIGSLTEKDLVEKLIGCDLDLSTIECNVLCSLSIFDHIGYEHNVKSQFTYIAEKVAGISESDLYKTFMHFKYRGIIDLRGDYLQVVPKPLAIRLAEEWWKFCLPSKAESLFTDGLMDTDLLRSFCKQFRFLDYIQKAKDAVNNLCGDQAPFGHAEVLFSERGSMVFRYLVEVNPQITANTLYNSLYNLELSHIRTLQGRSNILISLEMLCYWNEVFYKSAYSLMLLALAEDEIYTNGATRIFVQLFQIRLSGANASFSERLPLIDDLINRNNYDSLLLAVKALENVIYYGSFTKFGSPEIQGTKLNLHEWVPELWEDVFVYIRAGLNKLLYILETDTTFEELIRNSFEHALYGLLRFKLTKEITHFVTTSLASNPCWNSLLQLFIRYEKEIEFRPIPVITKTITKCKELLQPKNLEDQIKSIICSPPYDCDKINDTYVDSSKAKAIDLLKNLLNNNMVLKYLPLFLKGEQRYGLDVGYALAEKYNDQNDCKKLFLELSNALTSIPKEEVNFSIFGGFLYYLKLNDIIKYEEYITIMKSEKQLKNAMFDLILAHYLDSVDLDFIVTLLEDSLVPADKFRFLSHGMRLKSIKPQELISFLKKSKEMNSDLIFPSIEICSMYLYLDNDDTNLPILNDFLQDLLVDVHFSKNNKNALFDTYHWEKLLEIVLKFGCLKPLFLKSVIDEVSTAAKDTWIHYDIRQDLKTIIFLLLKLCFKETWDDISSLLLNEEYHGLIDIIDPKMGYKKGFGIESVVQPEVLVEWCKNKQAYRIIPFIINIFTTDDNENQFNRIIYQLFDLNLYDKEALDNIYLNMNPRSWSGSLVPVYKKHIKVLNTLDKYNDQLVISWKKRCIDDLGKRIEYEKEQDKEDYYWD